MPKLKEPPVQDLPFPEGEPWTLPWFEWLRDILDRMNERAVSVLGTADEIVVVVTGGDTYTVGLIDPLIVAKGGTGVATLTAHGILLGNGAGALTALAEASDGQLPIGDTGADPVLAALTGTTNQVDVTNGAGSITLATPQDIHTGAQPTFDGMLLTDDLVLPKTAGKGIKVEVAAPTFGWHDLLGEMTTRPTAGAGAAAVPDYVAYRGNIYAYRFGTLAPAAHLHETFIEFHVPHDYVPDSDIHLHIHWSQIVVDTGGAAGVPGVSEWQFDISYADGHGTAGGAADPFIAEISPTLTQQGSTTQYGHMIAEFQLSAASPSATQLDSNTLAVDGLVLVRMFRDPGSANDTLDQDTFVHFMDIHYQSTGIGTKQKAPDFYV